ncbi:hypothetical protein QE422_001729 [Chryseobacterium sp. SORGH_AS 447]|uniref:hypothetical protein n=1 Tax=Chryseobacterium sp. SORGH_AS_0447 TaxID=3041769 RepID=UPI0027888B15|nr:hypothetical protein [Chryseobacterium sp. SORGH_AS_0447]MDQ1161361.1 hypothetical protein [Chryseobacterium sp. SORGH_AS_0447]
MTVKIKFKKSEILANILLNLAGLCIGGIIIFHNNTLISGKNLIIKIIVFAGITALIFNLWIYVHRYVKSLNNVSAFEIDELGIYNNISKHTFINWNEISCCRMKTVQMSSGRHSKILIHTYNPSLSMTINTDLLDIDKNKLLDILNQKNDLNKSFYS